MTAGACIVCQGTGALAHRPRAHGVLAQLSRRAAAAASSGRDACDRARGSGQQTRTETVTVRDAGRASRDGDRVRVAGQGQRRAARRRRRAISYITVQVAPHPLFRREGDDLHIVVPIAVHEAALGARVEVADARRPARLRVPPGTQSGQRFRSARPRRPSTRDGRRGDLVVEVRLMLPRVLDERSKELLREFGRINGDET